jgi:DNA polymerase-3 subunit epsilon
MDKAGEDWYTCGMSLDFTAIDFETANPSRASACAVGLVKVRDGQIMHETGTLIQPPLAFSEFSYWNTKVHGITPAMVANAPAWRQVAFFIRDYVMADLLVAHNAAFDMSVLRAAYAVEDIPVPDVGYVCTLQLARRACALPSNKLPDVAAEFGVRLDNHHDAGADARCAAKIAVAMARRHGHDKLEQMAQSFGVSIGSLG